jgi:urease gamma subunit
MLADPQSVTINSVAQSLPAVARGVNTSSYQKDDGLVSLTVSHIYGKRTRRTVRLNHSKIAADPLISSQNIKYSMSAYLVMDVPITGYTVAEAKQIVDGLTAYLTASSSAKVTSVLGGES